MRIVSKRLQVQWPPVHAVAPPSSSVIAPTTATATTKNEPRMQRRQRSFRLRSMKSKINVFEDVAETAKQRQAAYGFDDDMIISTEDDSFREQQHTMGQHNSFRSNDEWLRKDSRTSYCVRYNPFILNDTSIRNKRSKNNANWTAAIEEEDNMLMEEEDEGAGGCHRAFGRPDVWITPMDEGESSSSPTRPRKWIVKRVWDIEEKDAEEPQYEMENSNLAEGVQDLLGVPKTERLREEPIHSPTGVHNHPLFTVQKVVDIGGVTMMGDSNETAAETTTTTTTLLRLDGGANFAAQLERATTTTDHAMMTSRGGDFDSLSTMSTIEEAIDIVGSEETLRRRSTISAKPYELGFTGEETLRRRSTISAKPYELGFATEEETPRRRSTISAKPYELGFATGEETPRGSPISAKPYELGFAAGEATPRRSSLPPPPPLSDDGGGGAAITRDGEDPATPKTTNSRLVYGADDFAARLERERAAEAASGTYEVVCCNASFVSELKEPSFRSLAGGAAAASANSASPSSFAPPSPSDRETQQRAILEEDEDEDEKDDEEEDDDDQEEEEAKKLKRPETLEKLETKYWWDNPSSYKVPASPYVSLCSKKRRNIEEKSGTKDSRENEISDSNTKNDFDASGETESSGKKKRKKKSKKEKKKKKKNRAGEEGFSPATITRKIRKKDVVKSPKKKKKSKKENQKKEEEADVARKSPSSVRSDRVIGKKTPKREKKKIKYQQIAERKEDDSSISSTVVDEEELWSSWAKRSPNSAKSPGRAKSPKSSKSPKTPRSIGFSGRKNITEYSLNF